MKTAALSLDIDQPIEVADCRDFLGRLPDDSARLFFSSPPYGIGKSYEKGETLEQWMELQRHVLAEAFRVLQPGGWLCWQVGNHVFKRKGAKRSEVLPLDYPTMEVAKDVGFSLQQRIIWHFRHGLHAKHKFSGRHETICVFSKGVVPHFDADKHPDSIGYVWDIPNVKANHPEKTEHPCQFPIELAERCILSMTLPGELVVDPFAGVGTVAIAAIKQGRAVRSCDRDPTFVATARRRLSALRAGTLGYRPMGKPVHTPKTKEAA